VTAALLVRSQALFFCLSLFAASALHSAEKPNILVLLVDDMGPMDTSLPFLTDGKGQPKRHPLNELYRTPNMEILASRGMRFETFYANSVCSPTRVSIMTGQSSARHHTTQWIRSEQNNRGAQGPPNWNWDGIKKGQQTLVGLLNADGYHTIHVGKAHFGPIGAHSEFPQNFGFDVNVGGCSWGQPGSYYGTDGFGWINGNKRRAVPDLEEYHGEDIYLTQALTLEMNSAIEEAVQKGKPFFAYMAYYGLHSPFMPDKRYASNYADADLPANAKAFASMVESMDASVGEILQQLKTLGVADNTLVLFLGDNGSDAPLGEPHLIASSAPLRGKKATHYEGGIRVPFIAAWAQPNPQAAIQSRLPILQDSITTEMGSIHDIFPTLLDLADVRYTGPIDGDNLAPVFAGGTLGGERDFLMHFPHSHRSSYYTVYRRGTWKLIYHYNRPESERYELFNLKEDPSEGENLAQTQPEVLDQMMAAMAAELEAAGAQYPVSEGDQFVELKPVLP
jgi:arylsulfatase A-like enzyme